MQNPDERVVPDMPTEPYWENTPKRCRYISAIGKELGYIQRGSGTTSDKWFSFLGSTEESRERSAGDGLTDREAAKAEVTDGLQKEWDQMVQKQSENKGKQR